MSIRILLTLAAVSLLGVSACGQESSGAGGEATQKVSSPASPARRSGSDIDARNSNASAAAAEPDALPKELKVEQLAGGWRVARVFSSANLPAPPASSIAGAILEVYPEAIRWSYKPEGAKGLDDFCSEPVAGIVIKPAAIKKIKDDFAFALKRLERNKSGPKKPGPVKREQRQHDKPSAAHPHAWYCGGGGKFGPSDGIGADFVMLSGDAMLLRWTGGRLICLERLNRPAPKANMQPSDYQPDKM